MFKHLGLIFMGITSIVGGIFGLHTSGNLPMQQTVQQVTITQTNQSQTVLSRDQLLALADNKYADGNLPLGDNKYVTNGSKKGYIYLCHANTSQGGGAGVDGSWIHGTTWNYKEKINVSGSVSWPTATFSNSVLGDTRTLVGNGLPINHHTGTYPIQSSDPAYQYDRNPNSIKAQNLKDNLPANPIYSNTPYCMGGEAGIMLSGVALFNGFDAELRDAAAHEVQDSCSGHPEKTGEYHYHSLSGCFQNIDVSTVIGYALDGFPITGPKVAENKYLTTDNLDDCHGITSEITIDSVKKISYHYVMTQDFPYSISCFRGKPTRTGPSNTSQSGMQNVQKQFPSGNPSRQISSPPLNQISGEQMKQPPQEAVTACTNKTPGITCSFTTPRGDSITGICNTDPQGVLVCIPNNRPH